MYDQAMEFDLNAVTDMIRATQKYPEQLLRCAPSAGVVMGVSGCGFAPPYNAPR